jgi:hypothetical protein
MTADELNAIRYLTIGLAKETFKQDYESFGKEDDDYIREKLALDSYCKGVEDVLRILENMKQEQRWIPTSERLPEKEPKKYWVCVDTGYQCECRWTNMNLSNNKTAWHWNIIDIPQYTKVVAWKPISEPYKVESEK